MKAAQLSGWGRVPVVPGVEIQSEDLEHLTHDLPLARGLGRAYGDAALPAPGDHRIAGTRLADRILAFDDTTGELTAEAGLSLDDICRTFLPRGFFVAVTPGTRFVTLGGMVAADVHGKSHHRDGSFGQHVRALKVRVGDGRIVVCSAEQHQDLFRATIGGMGLTGAILEVTTVLVRVPSPWIYEARRPARNIDDFFEAFKAAATEWPMTVGWIDCLSRGAAMGRGVLFCGRWAETHELPSDPPAAPRRLTLPLDVPGFALSRTTVGAFNALYHRRYGTGSRAAIVHPYTFFYPLDAIDHWERLYGRSGFTQYQCVLPAPDERRWIRRLLERVTGWGAASFLCTIKDFGPEGPGLLSFPMRGTALAFDLPMRRHTQELIDALNQLVIEGGGRVYLAKDALTRPQHFRAMEPRLDAFLAVRRKWDPQGRVRSAQSARLFGW